MAIVQSCSYKATIQTPLPPENYSAILVSFAQDGQTLLNKNASQLLLQDGLVIVRLTQEETAVFKSGIPAFLQIRCYRGEYDAPGSQIWPVDVWPALNKEVLSNGQ